MKDAISLDHLDGWTCEITEQPDGSLRVIVSGMVRRMWQAERATIEEAIALAYQIRGEQAASQPPPHPPPAH